MTKQQILELILYSGIKEGKPVEFKMEDLRFPFGFKRMDGLELSLRSLIFNGNEEQLQTASEQEIHNNIENWCKENNRKCYYNIEANSYIFK